MKAILISIALAVLHFQVFSQTIGNVCEQFKSHSLVLDASVISSETFKCERMIYTRHFLRVHQLFKNQISKSDSSTISIVSYGGAFEKEKQSSFHGYGPMPNYSRLIGFFNEVDICGQKEFVYLDIRSTYAPGMYGDHSAEILDIVRNELNNCDE